MPKIQLYSYYRSSAAYRVRIALNLKNIPFQTLAIHLINDGGENWKPDYLKVNPQGLVPAMVDEGHVFFQSLAIIEYIEEKYPGASLLPDTPENRALARGVAQIICSEIHPVNNLRILAYLKEHLSASQQAVDKWYCHWIHEGFTAVEKILASRTTASEFCFANFPTIADLCLIPQVYNARRFNCDLSCFPRIQKIDQLCSELPAFTQAAPEVQPDAPST